MASAATARGARRFDERFSSRFADLPLSAPPIESLDGKSRQNPIKSDINIDWNNVNRLNSALYRHEFALKFGSPTAMAVGEVIAIATSKGCVLIFDLGQALVHQLADKPTVDTMSSRKITALALSLDGHRVAAGFQHGNLLVWSLLSPASRPVHVQPLSERNKIGDGHVVNAAITSVAFVGRHSDLLVSSDTNGLVILHHLSTNPLLSTHRVSAKKLLGKYEDIGMKHNTVFECAALPLGTLQDVTDELGLVAVISSSALVVISTHKSVNTEFKIGKPNILRSAVQSSGCVAWFPTVQLKNGDILPPRLAYTWLNVITVIDITTVDNKLNFDSRRRTVIDDSVLALQWLNHSVLAVVTSTHELIFINDRSMNQLIKMDLISKHLYNLDFYKDSYLHIGMISNLSNSFKTLKNKLFLLGKYEFYSGSLPNWSDILYELVQDHRYVEAIEQARQYYLGCDDLPLVGLPSDPNERHKLVLKVLVDTIKASATHLLNPEMFSSSESINEFLYSSIKALISIDVEISVYENLYEIFKYHNHIDYYFNTLESFILTGFIKNLTPTILKDMVEFYIANKKIDTLEKLICLLNIKSIDIDFTLSLLKKNNLNDSYIYIWTNLIHDYITPLFDYLTDINDDNQLIKNEKVYAYLVYILTGRKYPTENLIEPEEDALNAKLSIYYVLFNGGSIDWEYTNEKADNNDNESFPYLLKLLKYDSKAMLSVLNECFEDSMMNDDEIIYDDMKLKVNRQFIIEILIEIFKQNEKLFNKMDHLNLAIFIARNYPKFPQFIRLSENILQQTIKTLCDYEGEEAKEDCQLSLQSFLSIYHPSNKHELLKNFEKAGFTEILLSMYMNDHQYAKVLKLWLTTDSKILQKNSIETTETILNRCLSLSKNFPTERSLINGIIDENFEKLVEKDTFKIVKILNKFNKKFHNNLFHIKSEKLRYTYLIALTELEAKNEYTLNVSERNEYVKLLSKFDRNKLFEYLKSLSDGDFEFKECIETFRENQCIDVLIYFFKKFDEYEDALNEVISYIKHCCSNELGDLGELEVQLWKYLLVGIEICETAKPGDKDDKLNFNEQLWLKLINSTVELFKNSETEETNNKILDLIKRLVQDLFSSLINRRSQIVESGDGERKTESSFLKIFKSFLDSSSMNITLLGDLRSVTKEIYLAFSYEKNVLTITSRLINETIYGNMTTLSDKKHIGWSVGSYECDACGKIIWGRGIDSRAFKVWEERQIGRDVDGDEFCIVCFNCHHCYHFSCLKGLGVRDEMQCVLCLAQAEAQAEAQA